MSWCGARAGRSLACGDVSARSSRPPRHPRPPHPLPLRLSRLGPMLRIVFSTGQLVGMRGVQQFKCRPSDTEK